MADLPTTGTSLQERLVIIGGGVMGLFTAYEAARMGMRVTILEKGRVGNPETASFGLTRSVRRDYLDHLYVQLAEQSLGLWSDFEGATGCRALVRCGCMNVASSAVTDDLANTYAQRSEQTMRQCGITATVTLEGEELAERFPYLDVDLAILDPDSGVADLTAVTAALLEALGADGTRIVEAADVYSISPVDDLTTVSYSHRDQKISIDAEVVVITAGHGSNQVLDLIPANKLQVPITRDRPSEAFYYRPPVDLRSTFESSNMPVLAYLDTGIYVHPIIEGVTEAVKIGYYNPPDIPRDTTGIASVAEYVERCMPGIATAEITPVTVVDQCDYDLVDDDDFVLGQVPGFERILLGVGWRGTGYKFAPWVGQTLASAACRQDLPPEIQRFSPSRFLQPAPEIQPDQEKDQL